MTTVTVADTGFRALTDVVPRDVRELPVLRGIGTAVPALLWTRAQISETLSKVWNLHGSALERWRRIVDGSGIDIQRSVLPIELVLGLTTAQRMTAYEQHAPTLAEEAARKALRNAGVRPAQITDLIVVSCTGFSAPGVDVELVIRLGLHRSVRRTLLGFMGCFGGISGLRTAVGACAADANAMALVVCVELCSLHVRPDPDVQNQVATALFADGAAAAVVAPSACPECVDVDSIASSDTVTHPPRIIGRLDRGAPLLLEQGKNWMTWRITDAGFAMTLSREVPVALREALRSFVGERCIAAEPSTYIIHPGGPGILNAVDAALSLHGGRGLQHSQAVLRRVGNVSSATVLFVLEEALRHGCKLPAMMLAFGPGLTIESLQIHPHAASNGAASAS